MSNISGYVSNRLDDQIKWHSAKSRENKSKYHLLQVVTIIISALIPIINLSFSVNIGTNIVSSILRSVIVAVTGITQLKKYQDNWIMYRTTSEILKKEKNLFMNNAGQYSSSTDINKKRLLVENVENIVSAETSKYFTIHHPTGTEAKVQPPEPSPSTGTEAKVQPPEVMGSDEER